MASEQCNATYQQYLLLGVVIGIAVSIILFLLCACIRRICCRTRKWPPGISTSNAEKWERIEELSKKHDTRPLSIIYACSLLDHILMQKGYFGESLHERLDSAHTALGNSQIKKTLRLRNELAHKTDMKYLDKEQTQGHLKIVRQALFDLNVSV